MILPAPLEKYIKRTIPLKHLVGFHLQLTVHHHCCGQVITVGHILHSVHDRSSGVQRQDE